MIELNGVNSVEDSITNNNISKKVILAGIFGHALECYDFTLYAFLSPILATVFFPHHNSFNSLLLVFTVFASSYVIRPMAGIFFGFLGDHFGRKLVLIVTMVMMSVATFILGLLPGYNTIGFIAPILLMILRLVQGIATAGEMGASMCYLVEHAPPQRRGWMGSLSMSSAVCGGAVGSGIIALISALTSSQQFAFWGWRLPFLLSGILGIAGLLQRLHAPETAAYQELNSAQKKSLFNHFQQLPFQAIFMTIALSAIMSIGFYLFAAYFNTFLIDTMQHSPQQVMLITFFGQLLLTALIPALGALSDSMGRKPVLMMGIAGIILGSHLVFWLFQQADMLLILLGESLFALFISPIMALIPTTLAEMFPVQTRNSGVSLGYSISQAIFGGTAPLVALTLTARTNNLYAPAWYLSGVATIVFLIVLTLKETYRGSLK